MLITNLMDSVTGLACRQRLAGSKSCPKGLCFGLRLNTYGIVQEATLHAAAQLNGCLYCCLIHAAMHACMTLA